MHPRFRPTHVRPGRPVASTALTAGPVWFTVRPDENFRDGMSRWMDRRVDGALGGSALRHFRVVVDYPSATAVFLRPGDDGP